MRRDLNDANERKMKLICQRNVEKSKTKAPKKERKYPNPSQSLEK